MPAAVAIIINGISRKKKKFYRDIYPDLNNNFTVTIFETKYAGHALELGSQCASQGFEFIIAAGGDGTLNQVVNGVMTNALDTIPTIGLIPLGTGNDFARTSGLLPTSKSLIQLIHRNQPRPVDVGRITCVNQQGVQVSRYFINACSVGMGPEVVKRLANRHRALGPFLTYWKAITTTFFTHHPQMVECKANDWTWNGKTRVLAIANGRSFGNSIFIAPDAEPDDRMFNSFIAGDLPLIKFLFYQSALKKRVKVIDTKILYNKCTEVTLTSPSVCPIESEGEIAGFLPAKVELIPQRLHFLR